MKKQKINQRNVGTKLHLGLFTQNLINKDFFFFKCHRYESPKTLSNGSTTNWKLMGKKLQCAKVLPVPFPIKTKEAQGKEQMVPLVIVATNFFTKHAKGNLLVCVWLTNKKIKRVKWLIYFIHCKDLRVCMNQTTN